MTERKCGFEECGRPYACKGYCNAHAAQMRRRGRVWPLFQETRISDRILAKATAEGDCLVWQGLVMANGYGVISWHDTRWLIHRAIWTELKGEIPAGLTIDHLCRRRNCVNVDHMEIVTRVENSRRGGGLEAAWASYRARTHCKRGHPLSGENLRLNKKGQRICKECGRASWHRWKARKKAAALLDDGTVMPVTETGDAA